MPASYSTLLELVRDFTDWFGSDAMIAQDSDADKVLQALLLRARAAIAPSVPKNDQKILHTWPDVVGDMCCAGRFTRAARGGVLDAAERWECPGCGTVYTPTTVDDIRRWEASPDVHILR